MSTIKRVGAAPDSAIYARENRFNLSACRYWQSINRTSVKIGTSLGVAVTLGSWLLV